MEVIEYDNTFYPLFQTVGFASKFCFPFAKEVCKGYGYDIGCNRVEWSLPGSIPIDIVLTHWDAYNLPEERVDYIFSSHMLEHVPNWVECLDYWTDHLVLGGILFLYLPSYQQKYWRNWNNRKHIHNLSPEVIKDYLVDRGYINIFVSGVDLNSSFTIMAENNTQWQ